MVIAIQLVVVDCVIVYLMTVSVSLIEKVCFYFVMVECNSC